MRILSLLPLWLVLGGCATVETQAPALSYQAVDFLELGAPMMERMRMALVQHRRGEWDTALETYAAARRKAVALSRAGGPERRSAMAALDSLEAEVFYGKAYAVSQNPSATPAEIREATRWLEEAVLRNPDHRAAYLLWEEMQAWRRTRL